jgi:hypothetical protein
MMSEKDKYQNTITDWILERYILEELPSDIQEQLTLKLEVDKELEKRLQKILNSNNEILENLSPEEVKIEVYRRFENLSKKNYRKKIKKNLFLSLAPAFVMVLLIITFLPIYQNITHEDIHKTFIEKDENINIAWSNEKKHLNNNVRQKGLRPYLLFFKKDKNKNIKLKDDALLKGGNSIQVKYISGNKKYGVIFSIDGNGVITLHFPEDKNKIGILEKKETALKLAFQLDNAPHFEKFFFITSNEKIDIDFIIKKAKGLDLSPEKVKDQNLQMSNKFEQFTFVIRKP